MASKVERGHKVEAIEAQVKKPFVNIDPSDFPLADSLAQQVLTATRLKRDAITQTHLEWLQEIVVTIEDERSGPFPRIDTMSDRLKLAAATSELNEYDLTLTAVGLASASVSTTRAARPRATIGRPTTFQVGSASQTQVQPSVLAARARQTS